MRFHHGVRGLCPRVPPRRDPADVLRAASRRDDAPMARPRSGRLRVHDQGLAARHPRRIEPDLPTSPLALDRPRSRSGRRVSHVTDRPPRVGADACSARRSSVRAPSSSSVRRRSARPRTTSIACARSSRKVERPSDVRILWEPRGAWPPDLVATLCRELELVHVVDPFVSTTVTPEQTYFRLHGISGARHVYTDAELEQLADMLPAGEGRPAYVLFNNLPRVEDARRFRAILSRRRSEAWHPLPLRLTRRQRVLRPRSASTHVELVSSPRHGCGSRRHG